MGLERDQGTHSFAAPAFAGCAFVVGLVTLSYRVAKWLSSASADGSIRVSSGHVRSHRQQQEPSQLEAPSWDSANSLQLTAREGTWACNRPRRGLPAGVLSYCPPSYRLATLPPSPGPLPGVGGRDCGEKPIERARRCASTASAGQKRNRNRACPQPETEPDHGALPPHGSPFAHFRLRSLL